MRGPIFSISGLLLLVALGCAPVEPPQRVKHTMDHYEGPIVEPDTENRLLGLSTHPVVREDGPDFLVEARTPHVKPCASCHGPDFSAPPGQSAHWDLSLEHGSPEAMNCTTCHEEEQKNLHLLTGSTVSFDDAYNLCGQCHFQQKKDWVGGSHGKRLATWAGTRVIRNCTGCHNPHAPGFPARWPAMAPGPINSRPAH